MNTKTIVIALALAGTTFQLGASTFNKEANLGVEQVSDPKPKKQSIMDQLGLSKEQKKSFILIDNKYDKQIDKIKNDDALDKEVKKTSVKTLRDAKHAEYKKMLTPEQYQKFEQLYAEKKEAKKVKEKKKEKEKLKEALGLTDDQVTKVEAIQERYKAEIKAIEKDASKTDTEKETLVKELKQKQRAEIKLLLTPEQLKKLEAKEKQK